MGSVFVVFHFPMADLLANLVEVSEQVEIEHFVSDTVVEAFDKGILIRLTAFDVIDEDTVLGAPTREDLTQELRAVDDAQDVGQVAFSFDPLEQPHEASRSKGSVDLDSDGLPVVVIDKIEQPKARTLVQRVAHEVGRPDLVRLLRHYEG